DANSMARLDENLHMSSIGLGRGQAAKLATIAPEGLTLEVKGENIKDEEGNAAENITYTGVPRTNFYTQFLMSDTGILMKADDTVAPETLVKAANQVDAELGKAGTGIAERMAEFGCSLAIYSPHENVYLIPEHRSGYSYDMYDVEGYGGSTYNKGVSSIAERNITRTRDNTEDPDLNTAYRNENILLHEFGHCVKSVGIDTLTDKTLSNEYKAVYKNAKEGGLWPNTYAMGNSDEFFATMCAIWFNNMAEKPTWDDGVRCPINTREEMKKYDPVTYAYFEKILPSDIVLMSPWDEPAPDEYHDEYVDPTLAAAFVQKIADKVDALPATDALTMDDAEAVEAIRASYDLLNEGQKALFDEEALTKLEAAEETIEVLKVLAENGDALNAVKEQIAALPEIADDTELTEEQIAAINAAKAAYDALPEEAKALIDAETTAKLTAAVEKAAEQTAGETPGETAGGETPGTTPGGTTPGTTPGTAPAPAVTETELAKLEAQIFALKNKKELPTAEYGKLKVKQKTVKKSSIKISWSKIKGASGYVVYGNTKGAGKPFEKLATVTKNSYTQKKLKKGTYYKYLVVAFQNVGTDQKVLSASKTVTIATSGGKAANPGKVKAKKKSLTVKVKKKVKISASAAKPKKGKVKKYRKLSFESADKTIATVTSKGVVKGVKKGKVKIYVYAQNGLSATVTVKVKK
ncbi:MAG: Ig-like domain-containing protein, partial [Lachnospiraceae bacterium]|nr:Ig-like domain-containing protein [Lachnospiraceae bacterium]